MLKTSVVRGLSGLVTAGSFLVVPQALALQFDFGEIYGSWDSTISVGAAWRMEERADDLVAKINLQPGLCTLTNYTDNPDFSQPITYADAQEYEDRGLIGGTCNDTSDPALNLAYVNSPGSYNINGDDGNLNFDRGDMVSAAFKMNTKLKFSWKNLNFQTSGIWLFNNTYLDFDQSHPDTTLQRPSSSLSGEAMNQFGSHFELQDAFVSTNFPLLGKNVNLRVGRQGFVWGEASALPLNSVNTVNPPDLVRQRTAGFDLAELFQPLGMVYAGVDLSLNLYAEAFYQYEWLPARIDAPGTFFSVSDILGGDDAGGHHAMLSFGKAPEDPGNIYSSQDNSEDPFSLGSAGGRTIYRLPDRKPRDGGQFGLALKYFAENFNNGTEFGFYYHNTHSRLPLVSFLAAQESCAADATNIVGLLAGCGALVGNIGTLRLIDEPLPIDTARLFVEYPENRHLFGVSFNTTVGNWAWAGEYTFRPNHPVQIHTVDLIFAALQPAFPRNNINIGVPPAADLIAAGLSGLVEPLLGLGVPATVLPGRRMAVPDYVQSVYRKEDVTPGMYIRGYEELKQGQLVTSMLRTFGATENPVKADQILLLAEFGLTHIIDMPSLNEIQFQGAETNTHASSGADGTTNGIADSSALTSGADTNGDGDARCVRQTYSTIDGAEAEPCRQNPTAQDPDQFGDDLAYGIRVVSQITYNDFFRGWNFLPVVALFYDIDGIAPGLGQNFQEGKMSGLVGLRFSYLNQWLTELRYSYEGGKYNPLKDRDTLSFTVSYTF